MTPKDAAIELIRRRKARSAFSEYVRYLRPKFKWSPFSEAVCASVDQFVLDVIEGRRPVLVLQAPPQHGKSELISRLLPPYLMSRFPDWRIGAASYSDALAGSMSLDVRRILASDEHLALFPTVEDKRRYRVNRNGEFSSPNGAGCYLGVGVGSGLTGRPLDIGIIDDPTKNAEEALSAPRKEALWNWYQTVLSSRLSECSGQIIMATSWAEDDLPARIVTHFQGDARLRLMRFPAINEPEEPGFNPDLPRGALVPTLKSIEFLLEQKKLFSEFWWSAMYQQSPRALGGNVFKQEGVRHWLPKDLPAKFDRVIASWDCTFKDTDGSDFVVGQIWGKRGPDSYLLEQVRARMSFTRTKEAVVTLRNDFPKCSKVLIEDKANGPAVIDALKPFVPGLKPVEPDGSKLARAHAVTAWWEGGNVFIPHPDVKPWVKEYIGEMLSFPNAAHDDQVDATTQALRDLYPPRVGIKVSKDAIRQASGYTGRR